MSTSRPSATEASRAAKRLTGQFANLRADNPTEFINSVAAIVSKYPRALVDELVETRALALSVEFFSLRSLGDWLDEHLRRYQLSASAPTPRIYPALPDNPEMAERCAVLLTDLAEQLRASNSRSPLDILLDKRAADRRESIERILGYAERVAPRDGI